MLTRLYLNNFRCFVNFEYRPTPRQLILGRNGSGKSSLLDALFLLRQFAWTGEGTHDLLLKQRTRWLDVPRQTSELEAFLDGRTFKYRLELESAGDPPQPRVVSETVHCDGRPIFEFKTSEVHLYNDRFEHRLAYPFDGSRSALAFLPLGDNQNLTKFRNWLGGLFCFRLNPFAMVADAEREEPAPKADLSNFAAWYRHLVQADPEQNSALLASLREVLDGFGVLKLVAWGEKRLLLAEFLQGDRSRVPLGFGELSDGQRCLICLYAILHFMISRGHTVVIDEPDNFVSLREIQPWLMAVTDAVEEKKCQVLIISHHPEIINQWAPQNGVRFFREGTGPVRVKEFRGDHLLSVAPPQCQATPTLRSVAVD